MISSMICFALMLVLQLTTPFWWWIMVVPFVYGMWKSRSAWESTRTGMCSAGALWLLGSGYVWIASGQNITSRVAAMLSVSQDWLMVVVTVFIAMLLGSVSASTGFFLKAALSQP